MESTDLVCVEKQQSRHLNAYEYNELFRDIDSLPYIDSWTDTLKKDAITLVENELRALHTENEHPSLIQYLASHRSNPTIHYNHDVLYKNSPEEIPIPELPNLSAQPDKGADISAWKSSITHVKAQIEATKLHILNTQLALEFAETVWLKYLKGLSDKATGYKKMLNEVQNNIAAINQKRKLAQVTKGNDLRTLAHDIESTFKRNRTTQSSLNQFHQRLQQAEEDLKELET